MPAFPPPPPGPPHSVHPQLAFDGSGIDGSLFRSVTDLARDTRWLNGPLESWTNIGLLVFALLMVLGWWGARKANDPRAMTTALAAPVAVVFAFAVAEVAKKLVAEVRPCRSVPHAFIVEACPPLNDYAFPSGHSTTAAATVAGLYLVSRRLCAVAALFALLEGFTRVYVGAHYPHDVLGAFVLALPVAFAVSALLGRVATPLVGRLSEGVLRPLLTSAPTRAAHAAR
ncbi:phosphatase PAP2 family protein [Phaeacidiphilus oryzae]|uniref:phosphatase PAP2 family protein n=1 Tax=Phaeacidiphilus oryzae TaxID=348818 RepID=UPI0006916066|nr:phosphatase PAP2 family protein [Phaeacidiphilus oryzae]